MVISEEDRKLIRKFEDIKRRGLYVQSSQLQAVYNRVFEVNLSATTCGSCLRTRTQKLVDALNNLEKEESAKKAVEATKNEVVDNTPEEEKEAATSEINEEGKEVNNDAIKQGTSKTKSSGKRGRKKGTK